MRISANTLIAIFTILGILFIILAVYSADDTIWNVPSVIFMLLAAMEFFYAIRLFRFKQKVKQAYNQKK